MVNQMAVKIIYFVHGTTTDNIEKLASGWNQAELSKKGIEQSIALKEQINFDEIDLVISSDLKRAQDSANYVFENTLYRELVSYINQCISQFDNVFDQEEFNADIDSAKLLALNTRIKHVYTDIKLVAEATGYDVPEYLDNRVLAVNSLAIELL